MYKRHRSPRMLVDLFEELGGSVLVHTGYAESCEVSDWLVANPSVKEPAESEPEQWLPPGGCHEPEWHSLMSKGQR